jgi:hypothetical protein
MRLVHRDVHDYSVDTRRLGGIGRRISRSDGARRLPHEGLVLLAASFYLLKEDLLKATELDATSEVEIWSLKLLGGKNTEMAARRPAQSNCLFQQKI